MLPPLPPAAEGRTCLQIELGGGDEWTQEGPRGLPRDRHALDKACPVFSEVRGHWSCSC